MIRENRVKAMLKGGEPAIGTFAKLHDPAATEILGLAGFDFIVIDNEHTRMTGVQTLNLIRAADQMGMVPTVRVGRKDPVEILHALDGGALGVQVPQTNTLEDVRLVVDAVKYAPLGNRGYAASQRSARYGMMNATEYAERSNEETMIVVYCESALAIQNLDDLLSVEEVDVVFIGPFDLSQALGVTGEPGHPKVREAIADITKRTRAAGKAAGIIASDPADAQKKIDAGIQYIALSADTSMIARTAKAFVQEMKG